MRFFFAALSCIFLSAAFLWGNDVDVTPVVEEGVQWFDASSWPTEGKGWADTNRHFARIPASYEELVPESVKGLAQNSAGLLVRFRTDSDVIWVKCALYSSNLAMYHMPSTGVSGLDLYVLEDGKWCWAQCKVPSSEEKMVLLNGVTKEMRDYLIYLPLYNGVNTLSIGVPEGTEFHAVAPQEGKPIVYYGTSITQGGCCSHPGNVYTSILSRRLNVPFINLGFSGSARMEPEVAQMIAELDPALFVIDSVPNMDTALINERGIPFVQTIRAAHPDTPILLVDGRFYADCHLNDAKRAGCEAQSAAYKAVYDSFAAAGDKNIYWLGHENLIGEDLDFDATMDSSHLNDLGMYRQAEKLEKIIREILQ